MLNATDYALSNQRDAWLRHPVLGDPSFDAFQRHPANPLHRGAPPLEWPVNGFLFRDPPSGHWYVYVGHYARGYGADGGASSRCTVFESTDDGQTWTHVGPIFPPEPFYFEGCASPAEHAPDVSLVYAEGLYHMAFDWAAADFRWPNFGSSGVGYAWSTSPRGPFQRQQRPLIRNSPDTLILNKYNRLYATTLLKRERDWLLLTLVDSGPYFSWGLVALRADAPGGPYSDPVPLFHTEDSRYQPPLMEYFPAFVHAGYVYAPATSVALNRNFQILHCAPLEQAHRPEAWELYQHGSLWHSEPVEHEAHGIWGQTLSGCVDPTGVLRVMFPSRDSAGLGSINLAARPWERPYREHGLALSGHGGATLTCLRCAYAAFELEVELQHRGTLALLWGMSGPLGADAPRSDATLHPLCRTSHYALRLAADGWRLERADTAGAQSTLAQGAWPGAEPQRLSLRHAEDGTFTATADGLTLWTGTFTLEEGRLGLLVEPSSWVSVSRFEVAGQALPTWLPWLYTEALLGAGQSMTDWEERRDPCLRYGVGAISRKDGARAKWNFHGTGLRLWLPRGLVEGRTRVALDGDLLAELDLSADSPQPSAPLLCRSGLADGYHTLIVEAERGGLVVDVLETLGLAVKESCHTRAHLEEWLAQADALVEQIQIRRGGATISVDRLRGEDGQALEKHDEQFLRSHGDTQDREEP